jgi:hypothetical protein
MHIFRPANLEIAQELIHKTMAKEKNMRDVRHVLIFCFSIKRFLLREWLRQYAASRKVSGSRPDLVNLSIYIILPVALGPGVHSSSNINEYQKHKNNVSGEQSAVGA